MKFLVFTALFISHFFIVNSDLKPPQIKISIDKKLEQKKQRQICDLNSENGVCLNGGQQVIYASAQPKNLTGYWNFDDNLGVDQSGNKLHSLQPLLSGFGYGGQGYSAFLNGKNYIEIPHNKLMNSKTYSLSFWLFLLRDNSEDFKEKEALRFCPIIQKGKDNKKMNIFERSPAIFIDRKDKFVKVLITTSNKIINPEGEQLQSSIKIPYERWTHIALSRGEKKTQLYINGILDKKNITEGWSIPNKNSLFIGSMPWLKEQCQIQFYIDELRLYSRELKDFEVQAETGFSMGSIEPSFMHLGCQDCQLQNSIKSCNEGYHLCTAVELQTGVLQMARTMGWVSLNTNVWSYGAIIGNKSNENQDELGTAICCSNQQEQKKQ